MPGMPNTSPIAALLFDLDGTLVDSEKPGLEVLHQMACGLGLDWSHDESVQRFRGVPMPRCVSVIAQHLPADSPALDEVVFLRDLRAAMAERFRRTAGDPWCQRTARQPAHPVCRGHQRSA